MEYRPLGSDAQRFYSLPVGASRRPAPPAATPKDIASGREVLSPWGDAITTLPWVQHAAWSHAEGTAAELGSTRQLGNRATGRWQGYGMLSLSPCGPRPPSLRGFLPSGGRGGGSLDIAGRGLPSTVRGRPRSAHGRACAGAEPRRPLLVRHDSTGRLLLQLVQRELRQQTAQGPSVRPLLGGARLCMDVHVRVHT